MHEICFSTSSFIFEQFILSGFTSVDSIGNSCRKTDTESLFVVLFEIKYDRNKILLTVIY